MAKVWQRADREQAEDDLVATGYHFDMSDHPIPGVQWLSDEEAHALFDAKARRVMGISGDEFLRRYDAGEFDDIPDDREHLDYWDLVMLVPFGR
ncbi:MAG: hypothetical protein ACRDJW_07525 [Thermomicrobiales bacterium]